MTKATEYYEQLKKAIDKVEISAENSWFEGIEDDDLGAYAEGIPAINSMDSVAVFVSDYVIVNAKINYKSLSGTKQKRGWVVLTPTYWQDYGAPMIDWQYAGHFTAYDSALHCAISLAAQDNLKQMV